MVRFFLLFLGLAAVLLFYPVRDLYIKNAWPAKGYTLAETGFWTRDACYEAAAIRRAEEFQCRKHSLFGSFLGTSAGYSQVQPGYAD